VLEDVKIKRGTVKNSANVVSEMATAAARGDYADGIALGENYLHNNPGDVYVLE